MLLLSVGCYRSVERLPIELDLREVGDAGPPVDAGCVSGCDSLGRTCTLPPGSAGEQALDRRGCTGTVLASGPLTIGNTRSDAAIHCVLGFVDGATCCSLSAAGDGEWFLTDGRPTLSGGVPEVAAETRSAGGCRQ